MTEKIFGQETKFWPVETFNWPICQFYDLLHDEESRLNLDPPYQRGLVWDMDHKIKLIDSVISGLGIPSVYIRMNRDYSYEVIDGKQRIHTLCSFMDDAFPYNGKLYSEHDEASRRSFEFGTTVGVTMLKFITDEEALEIYNRINFNGVPHELPKGQLTTINHPWPGNIREQWDLGPGSIREGAGKLLPPMILPKITGLIPPEWTKTRPEPGFSFSKALDIKRTFIGYTAKKIEEAGNRYYLYRTDGTEGQISKESYKQMEKLLQKAGESGLEEDHRALLEFVFSIPYIGIYDPEPRIIEG